MKLFNYFSVIGGVVGGWVSFLLGGWDALAICLLSFMILDYVSGILAAVYNKELNSAKGFKGILKKVAILFAVALSAIITAYLNMPVRDIVVTFFVLNEGLSIVENLGKIVELPPIIRRTLETLRGGNDNG